MRRRAFTEYSPAEHAYLVYWRSGDGWTEIGQHSAQGRGMVAAEDAAQRACDALEAGGAGRERTLREAQAQEDAHP